MATSRHWIIRICIVLALVGLGFLLGVARREQPPESAAQTRDETAANAADAADATAKESQPAQYQPQTGGEAYLQQSPGASVDRGDYDWGLGDGHISKLLPYPQPCREGDRTPFDLWRYGGRGPSSWGSPNLRMPWDDWVELCTTQKPQLMKDVREYMNRRCDFHGEAIEGKFMSRQRKPIMKGPVARLSEGVDSWQQLAEMSPQEMRDKGVFPYKPLAHPLHSTAHMLFPEMWLEVHPEHRRMDVDFDIPDAYLPEYPPPMFLTNHKELGDVTGGREVRPSMAASLAG